MENRAVDLSTLPEDVALLVDEAVRSGGMILTRDGKAVARIAPIRPRQPGSARGLIHMAADFDETPPDLHEFF
jgi:antitoxin (DNA-binding transcriptional repressor) of toxin-antitoxin stability system